ncbi:MAG: leucine-rich repeat domain-containing protein [Gammaproteobacteria bacterium]|nr:leucine-rich repeat domain-containing protein [Gammaproteobacteria bacterium]
MHRKRLNDLVNKDGMLYFAGDSYTGQAYTMTEQGIVEHVYDVEAGTIIGKSGDILPLPEKGALRIDYDFLDRSGEEDALYNGEGFSGVSYDFEKTELVAETSYSCGMSDLDFREWHVSGRPKSIVSSKRSIGWYEDGSLEEQSITKGDFRVYSLNTDAPNKLRWLALTDQYDYDPSVLETFGLAQKLVLDGNKIDDQVLAIIEKREDFANITVLDISDSSVTDEKIADINLENIQELYLSDNKYITIETLHALKEKYPHCDICVDDKYL